MAKKYRGNIPDPVQGWDLFVELDDGDGLRWMLYQQDQEHSAEWVNIKVVADGLAEGKANYWFVWNRYSGKVGLPRDLAIMREKKPLLHRLVSDALGLVA